MALINCSGIVLCVVKTMMLLSVKRMMMMLCQQDRYV